MNLNETGHDKILTQKGMINHEIHETHEMKRFSGFRVFRGLIFKQMKLLVKNEFEYSNYIIATL